MTSLVRTVAETGSTNDDMKALALEGAVEGFWLRAERQTAGKGRMGRVWQGEDGNLFASTLVRVTSRDPAPATLSLVAAVAVHEALEGFTGSDRLTIKWPNDIMAGKAKLCGMLMERVGDAVIVGIGVNVASAPQLADREATSLHTLGAVGCNATSVMAAIAERFAEWLGRWQTYGIEPVAVAWRARAHPSGTALRVQLPDGTQLQGAFEALNGDGALSLRLADGTLRAIHAGDIFEI